jgi:hypothetical protein|tara:strand:+ start:385 stop:537 length:153 start_codon:yes stop_codon:yes gene_type:complete
MQKDADLIPAKPPEKLPEVKIDDLLESLTTEQLHLLEDIYALWTWHPGMG